MANFADYASKPVDDLPEVKLLPQGSYIWTVSEVPESKISAKGNHDVLTFKLSCVSPADDFENEADLEDFGNPAGEKRSLIFTVVRGDHNMDMDAAETERRQARDIKNITQFVFEHLGAEADSLQEALSKCVNHQFVGYIQHEADNRDQTRTVERIGRTAPLD